MSVALSDRERRRRRELAARKGWRARRERGYIAHGRRVPHERYRALALAHAYPVRQITRQEFARRYAALREGEGREWQERGLETHWRRYVAVMRCYRAQGQDFLTTNGQGARGLEKAGRARCERTVRRLDAGLQAMGLLRRAHVRRGGSARGKRDCLRLVLIPSFVRPSSTAGAVGVQPTTAPAQKQLVPRPDGRRDDGAPAAPAPNDSDEEVGPRGVAEGFAEAVPEPVSITLEDAERALREGFPRAVRDVHGDGRR